MQTRSVRGLIAQVAAISVIGLTVSCGSDDVAQGTDFEETDPDFGPAVEDDAELADMGPDAEALPDAEAPRVATSVVTNLQTSSVRAGDRVEVECFLRDQNGLEFSREDIPPVVVVAPRDHFERDGDDWRAIRAGDGTVACSYPAVGLIDPDPKPIAISPGDPDRIATQLDRYRMTAGDQLTATCEAFDAYDNPIEGVDFTFSILPSGAGIEGQDLTATITTAGIYEVACTVPGASHEQSHRVEVVPGLPASLSIMAQPNAPVYAIGQVVGVSAVVTDSYGNMIDDAPISVSASPSGTPFGDSRFRFLSEGTYTITVTVTGPTDGDVDLTRSVDVIVNSEGPSIACDQPFDGQMIDHSPGSMLTFEGSVADANGVQSLSINGSSVAVASDGSFSQAITAQYGINFVEIVAQDTFGEENSRACAFLVSSNYQSPSTLMADSVNLKLLQGAVDDGNPAGAIDSLNDILHRVLNSSGLRDTLHQALLAANPLKPNSCDQEVCYIIGCSCVFRSSVTYRNLVIDGPNTTSLDLVGGGLRANAVIRNFNIRVDIGGTLSTSGWVRIDEGEVDLTIDVGLQSGRPSASVRQINTVRLGDIDLDFSGVTGFFINVVEFLFEGQIRNLLENQLQSYVESNFNAVLDDVFSGLDVASLGSSFSVPTLDGTDTVDLNFSVDFSRIEAFGWRMHFGLGSRFLPGQVRRSTSSLGIAAPSGSLYLNPSISGTTGVGIHVAVLNSALHALWRGGFFDVVIDGSTLGGSFPDGAEIELSTNLPPVIQNLSNGDVKLMLGAIQASLTYPGIFDESISLSLGAVATTSANVSGDELAFSNIVIDELVFSTQDVSLQASTRAVIEGFLMSLMQSVFDSSLNTALPALPIPGFALPASLGVYGLPVGADLSIVNPTLETSTRHYKLDGNFGVR